MSIPVMAVSFPVNQARLWCAGFRVQVGLDLLMESLRFQYLGKHRRVHVWTFGSWPCARSYTQTSSAACAGCCRARLRRCDGEALSFRDVEGGGFGTKPLSSK